MFGLSVFKVVDYLFGILLVLKWQGRVIVFVGCRSCRLFSGGLYVV